MGWSAWNPSTGERLEKSTMPSDVKHGDRCRLTGAAGRMLRRAFG
jgi:hypothetical protein